MFGLKEPLPQATSTGWQVDVAASQNCVASQQELPHLSSGGVQVSTGTHVLFWQSWLPTWQQVLPQQNCPEVQAVLPQQLEAGAHTPLPHCTKPVGQLLPGSPVTYWLPPTTGTVPVWMEEERAMAYLNERSSW